MPLDFFRPQVKGHEMENFKTLSGSKRYLRQESVGEKNVLSKNHNYGN